MLHRFGCSATIGSNGVVDICVYGGNQNARAIVNKYLTSTKAMMQAAFSSGCHSDEDSLTFEKLKQAIHSSVLTEHQLELSELKAKYTTKLTFMKQELDKLTQFRNIDELVSTRMDPIDKLVKTGNNSILGDSGELMVYDYLTEKLSWSDGTIERVQGNAHVGDIHVRHENLSLCVEVKNHANAVSSANVSRFVNTDVHNADYNAGLFVSIRSGFPVNSGVRDFSIVMSKGKPLIFLANTVSNMDNIMIAIRVLKYLVSLNAGESELTEATRKITSQIELLKQLKRQLAVAKKAVAEMSTTVKQMETELIPQASTTKHKSTKIDAWIETCCTDE